MIVMCSYSTESFRFDLFNFVSKKGCTLKPSHEGVSLPVTKELQGTYAETHSPYKVSHALAHSNNDEFKIAAIHLS